jgi:hypothetical protein
MRIVIALVAVLAASAAAFAQTPPDNVKAMAGVWELSNSERDQLCNLTLTTEAARGGFRLDYDASCGERITPLKGVEAWTLANDTVRLLDGRGRAVFELSEVETGMYEGERKGEGLYFLQTAAAAAALGRKHSADELFGEWVLLRSDKPVCTLSFSSRATKSFDEYMLTLRAPCDAALSRLNPNVWRLDRGELVLASPNGQAWRFEAAEASKWRRVPESAEPIALQKK